MKKTKILVIDSGNGGRVVERYLKSMDSSLDIKYASDHDNMPYGEKDTNDIIKLTNEMIKRSGKCDILVIACNTISAAFLKEDIEAFTIVDIISPTIEELKTRNLKKLGIISTEYTHKSRIYLDALKIPGRSSKTLAKLVEDGIYENEIEIRKEIKRLLEPMVKRGIERIILGCTHYELIDYIIRDIYPHLELLYPGKYQAKLTVERVKFKELIESEWTK